MLWNWIAYHARQRPKALAVILSGQAVTYARLAVDIARAAQDLQARLPDRAALVGVGIGQTYQHWVCILALARLEIASVSITEAGDIAAAGPDALVADKTWNTTLPTVEVGAVWLSGAGDISALAVRDPERDFPMRMMVSSGTTGAPKRVLLSSSQIEQRMMQAIVCYQIGVHTRAGVQMGEGTSGGFAVPMASWIAGATVVLAENPMFNAKVPPAAKPNFLMLSAANLDALLAQTSEDSEAFPGVRFIVGGSPVPQSVMERARRRLSRHTGMVYGSTEIGAMSVDTETRDVFIPHCVGYAVSRVEIELVDEAGQPMPPVTEGEVRARCAYAATRYEGDPEASARHFRDGWFYPGDRGVFSPQGLLVITGRTGDLFNFGGVKVAPVLLEEVALASPGVTDAGACKLADAKGELAVVAVVADDDYDAKALAGALTTRFGKFRIALARVAAIPRNRMGKIERNTLAEVVRTAVEAGKTRH